MQKTTDLFGKVREIAYFCKIKQMNTICTMDKKVFIFLFSLFFCCTLAGAQEVQKSDLQKRAEAVDPKQNIASARSLYIHAFNDYYNKGQIGQGVECAVKATALYYKENFYKEAFDLLLVPMMPSTLVNSRPAKKQLLIIW